MKISRLVAGLVACSVWAMTAAPVMAQGDKPAEKPAETKPADDKPAPAATPETKTPETKPAPAAEEKLVYVKLATNKGDIVLELNNEKAPISTKNFLSYVEKKQYDGTIFHRVINDFMIQGGGFTADMKEKSTDAPIKNEWQNGLKNDKYTIAMARTNRPDSATCQFYINVKDNAFLNGAPSQPGYAVFGKVVAGQDVVDKIKVVKTAAKGMHEAVPVEPVVINTATKLSAEESKKFAPAEKK